jgi:phage shock protein PspC (stress-responsive transcriptional regulator)
MASEKRLCRTRHDRKLAGVCAGIADYFGWDPSLVRIGWIVLTLMGGSGLLLYLILWLVMPESA